MKFWRGTDCGEADREPIATLWTHYEATRGAYCEENP